MVPGYGNCLFHALGRVDGTSHVTLRRQICDTLLTRVRERINGETLWQWIDNASPLRPLAYIARMRRNREWGSAVEFLGYSMLRNVRVVVCQRQNNTVKPMYRICGCDAPEKDVYVLYNGVDHYDALLPGAGNAGPSIRKPPHRLRKCSQKSGTKRRAHVRRGL